MVYQESFKIQKNSRVIITNPYGKIASVQAYQIDDVVNLNYIVIYHVRTM